VHVRGAIRAGQVIISADEPPVPGGVVSWEGDRITAAGGVDALPEAFDPAAFDIVLDLPELTVMPGLIDSHGHITTNTVKGTSLQDQARADVALAVLAGVENLREDLHAGVTTMRVVGDPVGLDVKFRRAIERGQIPGPSLQTSARAFRPSHGTAAFLAVAVDGEEALRRHIRENFFLGADWIKLFVSNVMHGDTYVDYLQGDLTGVPAYSRAEIAAAIDEAHTLGMKVVVHAIGGPAMRWSIELGVDSVEHANLMEDGDVDLFVEHGTTLSDPNLQLFYDDETGFATKPNWSGNEWWQAKVKDAAERTARYLPEALRRGVNICLAVDSNHSFLWKELVHFVALGASETEALLAVTRNPARLLGLEREAGALRVGMRADIVAVEGDPLRDIAAVRSVRHVVARGWQIL
jgi:imidazolonepropionase-like amidohydrolase